MNVSPDTAAKLVFTPGRIEFRCQAPGDHAKLEPVVPKDQVRVFTAEWQDNGLRLVLIELPRKDAAAAPLPSPNAGEASGSGELGAGRVAAIRAEWARVAALTTDEAKALAVKLGVAWDDKAPKDAMVDRIVSAGTASRPPAGDGPEDTAVADYRARVRAMSDADLKTEAAPLKVRWDPKASRETMIDRVVEAWVAIRAAR
jgi:hypothetical protein